MGLAVISETITEICASGYSFSDKEKEFITQFAFKTGDKKLCRKLMTELASCAEQADSLRIMQKYSVMYGVKPELVSQVENLLTAIEMYRLEEEKALKHLEKVLQAHGIKMDKEAVMRAGTDEIRQAVQERYEEQEHQTEKMGEQETKCTLRNMAL